MITIIKTHFDETTNTVHINGTTLKFLKKEFELFYFLYKNPNHVFRREDLLNAVWSMESPVDRTVDDHIYRIRKKLKVTSSPVVINTIKGRGYQLVLNTEESKKSPLLDDHEFQEISAQLIKKYHLYGQGETIETVLQLKSFGMDTTDESFIIYSLIKGDFQVLLQSKTIELPQRILLLLFLYLWSSGNKSTALTYYYQAKQNQVFSKVPESEATLLTPIFFSIYAKDFPAAQIAIERAELILSPANQGLYTFLQLSKLMLALCTHNKNEIEHLIAEIEHILQVNKYDREIGFFFVLKGLYTIHYSNKIVGREFIDKGIEITIKTRFVSNLLLVVDTCLFLLSDFIEDPKTYKKVTKQWESLVDTYRLSSFRREAEKQLSELLSQD